MATWQPVQVTYKAFMLIVKVCGKRWVGKGAHSVYSGCSCNRRAFTSVLFIVIRVRVNTRSSLYRMHCAAHNTLKIPLYNPFSQQKCTWCVKTFIIGLILDINIFRFELPHVRRRCPLTTDIVITNCDAPSEVQSKYNDCGQGCFPPVIKAYGFHFPCVTVK